MIDIIYLIIKCPNTYKLIWEKHLDNENYEQLAEFHKAQKLVDRIKGKK